MVNSECNHNCRHCYISYKGHRSPKETVKLVDRLTTQGYKVTIAGAETLLNLDYLKAYKRAGQDYILTNGLLLLERPEIFDKLNEYDIKKIEVSLHFGIQKDLNSVPEEIVAKVIDESKKRDFEIQINTTINQKNYRNVAYMCRGAYELEVDRIQFIRYVKSGKARENTPLRTVTEGERELFFDLVDAVKERYDKDDLYIKIHGNFGPKKGTEGEELSKCNTYCPAGKTFFAISPDNNVYGCPFLMEYPIGKLIRDGIDIEEELCSGKRDTCITDYLLGD